MTKEMMIRKRNSNNNELKICRKRIAEQIKIGGNTKMIKTWSERIKMLEKENIHLNMEIAKASLGF
jgi:hypothetical protein